MFLAAPPNLVFGVAQGGRFYTQVGIYTEVAIYTQVLCPASIQKWSSTQKRSSIAYVFEVHSAGVNFKIPGVNFKSTIFS